MDNPVEKSPQGRFKSECEFLSTLRHPNVVQYLGTWEDPETALPVLLMELMDQSLTQFLEKSGQPLPFHVQVSISHDISLALSFLHSNNIIHRDLSSNNILMIGDRRAKVTDFGMARLFDTTTSRISRMSLTMSPGTDPYMPPEAVAENPAYTEKLDCFSFGVLIIQILSCKYPSPGKRTKRVVVGGRELLEPQTEFSRREEDIKIVEANHPLLTWACLCIKDRAGDRPSARDLCLGIAQLRNREEGMCGCSSQEEVSEKDRELERLREELHERNMEIEGLMDGIRTKDALIETKNTEIRDLEARLNSAQKDNLEVIKRASLRTSDELTTSALSRRPESSTTPPSPTRDGYKDVLEWRRGADAPCPMNRSSDAIVCGSFVYVLPGTHQQLCAYNWEKDSWTELLSTPTNYCTLANVKNSLVAIGGFERTGEKTNKLFNLTIANNSYTWVETYPPMPTKRDSTAAVCYGAYLVVAGGIETSYLKTVEILQVDNNQWLTAASLPSEMFSGSACVCGDRVYILGGWVSLGTITYSVMTCSLRALVNSPCQHNSETPEAGDGDVWSYGTVLPVTKSTCVSFQNQLLVVGGQDKDGDPTKKIWMYETVTKSWVEFSECEVARSQCYAAVLLSNQLMIAGGFTRGQFSGETNTTEVAQYTLK
jgi:serine/threonine protein kinase